MTSPRITAAAALGLTDWRRRTAELYATVRACRVPEAGHALWRAGRDELFRSHTQSPLPADDPLRTTGVPYFAYDPAMRFEVPLTPAEPARLALDTGTDGTTTLERVGVLVVPGVGTLDAWWLAQYGGGLFVPLRDTTAGTETYGGGRYVLDTAKGADLGGRGPDHDTGTVVVDLNFAYHPSCRYDPAWTCPLAPAGNRVEVPVRAGERLRPGPGSVEVRTNHGTS